MVDWRSATAPDLGAIEALAAEAWAGLPPAFKAMCGDVVVMVADFPDADVLEDLGLESEFDLLGLYQGVALTQQSVMDPSPEPARVFLYRRPILDYWAEHDESLGAIVRHVVVHEIGHHFGLSDADMDRIEDAAE